MDLPHQPACVHASISVFDVDAHQQLPGLTTKRSPDGWLPAARLRESWCSLRGSGGAAVRDAMPECLLRMLMVGTPPSPRCDHAASPEPAQYDVLTWCSCLLFSSSRLPRDGCSVRTPHLRFIQAMALPPPSNVLLFYVNGRKVGFYLRGLPGDYSQPTTTFTGHPSQRRSRADPDIVPPQ